MNEYDVIILGAGAAGLMCALTAGQRGRRVLLLDHADKIGVKILISGGGRCNFTNLGILPDRYLSNNPHFAKSALSRYTHHDFIALVEKHHIGYHEKTLGQLFCDGSARQIVQMLKVECDAARVEIRTNCKITRVSKQDLFSVETSQGVFTSPSLVIATGGPSIPKMGSTEFAYDIARQFGIMLTEIRPALVPLTAPPKSLPFYTSLAGVALDSIAFAGKRAFRENMLFTHRGISGPAVLQISSYWREGEPITLDLLPQLDVEAHLLERKKARPKAEFKTILAELLPQRFATVFAETQGHHNTLANMTDAALRSAAAMLKKFTLIPEGSEGYAKAEVTLGGVNTDELSSKTMACKKVPGLYFIGEAVDVTGWLGGYNFQWAWSSGWCAGQVC
jgi:predicted Rossmann fold flavoprotein